MPSLNPIGYPFTELPAIDSTNNYAMGLAREGLAQHGTAVFAHEQTKGKGQRNKEWLSAPGKNIAMSIVIDATELNPAQPFLLSMMTANAVRQFLNNHAADETKIKWPNDIYWRDRKAAGILIENVWQAGEWKFAIAGIGININQTDFGELGEKAVSLKQITGKEFVPVELAKEVCYVLEKNYQQLIANAGLVIDEYKAQLYRLNRKIKLKKNNRIFEAVMKEVTTNGELVVQHAIEESFGVGEVEWII